ncbi:MAG: leucine-rich repeat domain-containing protein [Lachnospiraceae bacterium]|nr:leucine-rich repeat domain-containing protein [Lachnospiraceae bacterium]
MKKRILSMVLVCLLAFSATACGKDGGTQGGQTTDRADATDRTDAAQGTESGADEPEEGSTWPVWVEPEKEEPVIDWSAVETPPEEDFWFTNITIDGIEGVELQYYWGEDTVVKVPGTYDGKPVISIHRAAFQQNVTDVYIETESFLYVQDYAFKGCDDLNSVVIIAGEESYMGDLVFYECESLTSIVLSEEFVRFGCDTFYDTPWLENKRQENPLVILNYVLVDGKTCTGDVVIPDGVIRIGEQAFSKADITSLTLPDSVRWIDAYAFVYCTGLTSINLPDDIEDYGLNAYTDCKDIVITYQGKEYTYEDLSELRKMFY